MGFKSAFVASVAGLFMASAAVASVTTIQLDPSNDADGNTIGNVTTSAPGFASQSWQANATTAGAKSELYVATSALFTGSVTLNDVASVTYWTNKPGASSGPDWTFYMYTAPTGSGDEASWYHTRLNSEPYLTGTSAANDPANTWHEWSTSDATNPMRFYDAGRDGGILGTYTDPTLSDLQSGPINWQSYYSGYANNTYDYRTAADTIEYFSLQTGSAWADGFTGLVDGVTITLKNGDVGNINLEATVPEPTMLGGLVLLGLFGVGRRRK